MTFNLSPHLLSLYKNDAMKVIGDCGSEQVFNILGGMRVNFQIETIQANKLVGGV